MTIYHLAAMFIFAGIPCGILALVFIGLRTWWRYVTELEAVAKAARRTPITRRSPLAEFWADVDAWRVRQMAGRR